METIIVVVAAIVLWKFLFKKGNSASSEKTSGGGCPYCGGELYPTHKPGYSYKCKECRCEIK
nr:hypothetical protein [uncultured Desulfuromonas sp.]